jgi:hypothetical protein
MRTALRQFPAHLPSRRMTVSVLLVLSLAGALASWHGSWYAAALPVTAFALVLAVIVLVRRALRRASTQIDTILREELGSTYDRS